MSTSSSEPRGAKPDDPGARLTETIVYDGFGFLTQGDSLTTVTYEFPSLAAPPYRKTPRVLVRANDGSVIALATFLASKNCDTVLLFEKPTSGPASSEKPTSGPDDSPECDAPTIVPRDGD